MKHKGTFIVGYPVQTNILKQEECAFKNPLFDFVLVRAQTKLTFRSYQIVFIDLGVGNVKKKAQDSNKMKLPLLIQQLKRSKYF
jgi:hypothetical protein